MAINKYLDAELSGLESFVDYTGLATNEERIDALIDLVSQEHTQRHRGHLDQISPAAHRQLIVELRALKAELVEAP